MRRLKRWVAIKGGHHAQFGWYGPQNRDNPATISREAHQEFPRFKTSQGPDRYLARNHPERSTELTPKACRRVIPSGFSGAKAAKVVLRQAQDDFC
jgi:hypothetical protein